MRARRVCTGAFVVTVGVIASACGGRSYLELPTPDASAEQDGTAPDGAAPDAEAGADTAAPLDASPDAVPTGDGSAEASSDAGVDAPADAPGVLSAPRPIAPLSTSTATSQRPTLRWQLDPGSDGAQVEICRDRACTTIAATFTAAGTQGQPASALAAGVYFWRLHGTASGVVRPGVSPTWELVVGANSAPVDTWWGSIPDVDGDGMADGFTGFLEPNYEGIVFAYHGNANGPTAWGAFSSPPSSTPASFFGEGLAMAGDVDGDGYAELLVSDDHDVWMYPGGPQGLAPTPTLVLGQGAVDHVTGTLGDVDGDGYGDFAVQVQSVNSSSVVVYRGGPGGPTAPTTIPVPGFSVAFAPIGADMNGDGYGDLVVEGCTFGPNPLCTVYLFAGSAGGIALTPVVLASVSAERTGVTFAGDVNGDGYPDLADVIQDPSQPDASTALVVRVFAGGANGLGAPFAYVDTSYAEVPITGAVATVGDINADGYADLAVGLASPRMAGGAWVYYGGSSLSLRGPYGDDDIYDPGLTTTVTGWAAAGDMNGDGWGDVIAGDPDQSKSAYIFLGGPKGLNAWWQEGNTAALPGGDSLL